MGAQSGSQEVSNMILLMPFKVKSEGTIINPESPIHTLIKEYTLNYRSLIIMI